MSAPESRTQDQVRKAHNIIVKFKEGWKMKVATKATKIKMVLSRGLATRHPVKLVGLLALGTILMAGTAIQFAPKVGEESVNSPLMEKVEPPTKSAEVNTVNPVYFSESSGETHRLREELRAADREEDYQEMVRYWDRLKRDAEAAAPATSSAGSVPSEYRFMDLEDEPLSVEFLRTYVYPEEAAQVKAPAKSVDSEYRFMDLEDEPLSVEFLRTYVYPEERPSRSEATSSHQQEIERLEGEISTLLDEARQDPSTDPLELDRDLRNLDYQIDMLRLAAMEQQ